MYKKNKLGIYVYPIYIGMINNKHFNVNSINHNIRSKSRIINDKYYGIYLSIYK